MTSITITSDDPQARSLLLKALENYSLVNESLAVQARHREPHPGETRDDLDRRATIYQRRSDTVAAMAAQIHPGGQAG